VVNDRIKLIRSRIRDIPDFPKPGIVFKDITPLLADPEAFGACLDLFAERLEPLKIDAIMGIESRGFIFGGALAYKMKKRFVPARKPGKLPYEKIRVEYELEYGTDALEVHKDAIAKGERVLVLDDLLATGGTASGACDLVRKLGGEVAAVAFVVELAFLNGAARLAPIKPISLIVF
jgi:adenine phosphoribosyltransferase